MKFVLALACIAAAAAVVIVVGSGEAPRNTAPAQPEFVTAASVKEAFSEDGGSKAEWVAMSPQLWWKQIEMICDVSEAKARRYERQLGPRFRAAVLENLRADCV